MTVIQQLPQKIDSNVTVYPPRHIRIDWVNEHGWYITIDGKILKSKADSIGILYFEDVSEALDWLAARHLIVTKAYKELEKTVKKVSRSKKNE